MRNGTLGLSVGAADDAQAQSVKTQQRIDSSSERHLVRLVSQLLAHGGQRASWAPIILTLAREVCKRVKLNIKNGDKLNIRQYVKVKKIPGGNMQDCKYVDGVVITKNVTHKKMGNNFYNPRILLLSCSLEYQRVEGRLLFFDSLIQQEKPYLKMLVSKIAALKPDLVLVEKTVSRYAQEFLLEENISLCSNVKPHVMERLARQLRAELLPTLDILFTTTNSSATTSSSSSSLSSLSSIPPPAPLPANSANVPNNVSSNSLNPAGTSPPPFHFSAASSASTPKTAKPSVVEEKGEDGVGACGDFKIVRYQGDWGGKTLMHFEKCPKELGCTITIRGGTNEELARVKSIMLFCIYAAWSLHLERYLLLDEHATYQVPTDRNEKAYDQTPAFSISSQVEFQESSLPARLLQPHINSYTYTRTRYSSLHPQGKLYLLNSFQVPHSHAFFSHIEFPSLLQLQCTMEDDTPTICSCNHPFSIEPSPNPNLSLSPPTSPSLPPSPSPSLSSSASSSSSSISSVSSPPTSTPSLVAPVAMYPGRALATSKENNTINNSVSSGPHAHGHSHTCTHEDAHTAYSMQTLVYVHSFLCSTTATQCIPHELHAIDYYSENDIALGEFLETMCFDLARMCPVKDCNRPITQHERAFIHNNGRLNITVETVQRPVTPAGDPKGIYVSSYCKICKTATPFSPMSQETWNYSFGKFLELSFYCASAINQAPECAHSVYRDHIRYFSCGYLVAQMAYEPIQRLHVILPPIRLEHDANVKLTLRRKELELLTQCADQVYDAILAKLTQLQTVAEGGGTLELAQQVATFAESLQKEKSVFMTKLGTAREQIAESETKELRDLTRILYANFVMWNSMLNEVVNNANNVEAYKSKLQSTMEVSPRFSRDISKQDLATIAEHASDLSQPVSPSSSVTQSSILASLSNSVQNNTITMSPVVLSPQQPAIASVFLNSTPASANNSEPNSANSSYTNYNAVFTTNSSSSSSSSTATPATTNSPTPSHNPPPVTTNVSQLPSSPLPPSSLASSYASSVSEQPNAQAEVTTPQLATVPEEVTKGEPEVVVTPAIPLEVSSPISTPDLASPGMLAQSPNSIKPAAKPSKIMNTITNLVSAISSTRILDPTIPYLFLPQGGHNDIIVAIYENEPSTIIAYTLSSSEFKERFDQHYKEFQPPAATPAPVVPPNSTIPPTSTPSVTSPPSANPSSAAARSRSSSLSKPPNPALPRSASPTGAEARSRSSSLVGGASSAVAAAAAAYASVKAVLTSNTEVSDNVVTSPGPSPSPIPGPNSDAPSADGPASDSDNIANGSLSNISNATAETPTITTTPASNTENGTETIKENGKGNERVNTPSPAPADETKTDDGQFQFTDRNVTLAKYLLCGDHREIRNKYQLDKHGDAITIYCTTYYPLQFNAMRELMAGGEDKFIESLSRCKSWNAKGGKSGALWAKTLDDRYVIKQVSRAELLSFLDFAPQYFEYLCKAFFHKVPTLMSKIFGVYSVRWKNGTKRDLIIMENLHYNTTCVQVYDLKGSLRGRLIQNPINDSVLLDENLLQTNYTSPICITEYSKTILGQAVWNDTAFLSSLNVMDYSLLAGIGKNGELVVGIIDYIRRFTWDRQLENWVKIGLGRGKQPTVISPKQYKTRFRDAMWMYFVMVPNKFTRIIHPPLPSTHPQQDKEKEKHRDK